jgi:hypothetical protein
MPHLYLPSEHSDADLVLAADVAQAVSSADLYVAWTHEAGPGGAPEVEAIVREPAQPPALNPFAELFGAMVHGVVALWRHITGPPAGRDMPRLTEGSPRPAAGEPTL